MCGKCFKNYFTCNYIDQFCCSKIILHISIFVQMCAPVEWYYNRNKWEYVIYITSLAIEFVYIDGFDYPIVEKICITKYLACLYQQ